MQLHLMFGAFVLGVPIFASLVEVVGLVTKNEKYDKLAREFTRLLALAFTATAVLGVVGLGSLVFFYPKVISYLGLIFSPTYLPYALFIILDAIILVVYCYGWDAMKGRLKWVHILLGIMLNVIGTGIMCVANAWVTFMMSPTEGATPEATGVTLMEAIQNPLWMPINIHRFIANIAFGGAIVAAYAAIRFLASKSDEERAHYDWMGYVGNFTALWALIPLPFAGYWLGKEIYAYNPQMGTSLMGGAFSWLFIIQAVLIGALFIAANYYMWIGLGRIPGGNRYFKYILWVEILIFASMAVWMTPHTLVASSAEASKMGGAHHPLLGVFGVMSAKNTVVNIVILSTFLMFVLYRRANKKRTKVRPKGGLRAPLFLIGLSVFPILFCGVNGFLGEGAKAAREIGPARAEVEKLEKSILGSDQKMNLMTSRLLELDEKQVELKRLEATEGIHHAAGFRVIGIIFAGFVALALLDMFLLRGRIGGLLQWAILATAAGIVIYYGVDGYFVDAKVRIGYSVYQVAAVLFALVTVTAIDLFIFFGADSLGEVQWGKMPRRSQYVLITLAAVFTLTMALMGIVRSGIRETWHVYGLLRDTSETAYTPALGYGTTVAAVSALFFFGLLWVIFKFGMKKADNEAAK